MYINSLAIQAVVERTLSQTNQPATTCASSSSNSRNTKDTGQGIPDELLVTSISTSDYAIISEVVDASVQILNKTITISRSGQLLYAPVRIYLRIVSASIFLLKAISLGARNTNIQSSLAVLDECIQMLQSSAGDEMHLSSRYGTLIQRHVDRFRRNFVGPFRNGETVVQQSILSVPPFARIGTSSFVDANSRQIRNPAGTEPPVVYQQTPEAMLGQDTTFNFEDMQYAGDGSSLDDWLAQPFDPNIAPFGTGASQFMSGLDLESLNFLWNLPG
jgi:hypothetical protein